MKQLISLLVLLLIAACGDSGSSASPNKPKASLDDSLIGNWIDANQYTLSFKSDGTSASINRTLLWALDDSKKIVFMTNDTQVDICAYQIISTGGLSASLLITLTLDCSVAGKLSFTKVF